ncbi:hypothetical protein DKX38_006841 [Salix brachista]|uniref:EF-hand domain-containing protein n=1 Tax=Salix brachista TaxID=2182728 RepID=A0A5N5MLL8_9ROSI|nr:hypothetical protein DKX38_006841 [Salix brachista]
MFRQRSLVHDLVWSRFLKEIVLAPNSKQVREIFMRHVKDPDNNVLGWNELKAAFSELGAGYPDFRADRALVFADVNGDGLIAAG